MSTISTSITPTSRHRAHRNIGLTSEMLAKLLTAKSNDLHCLAGNAIDGFAAKRMRLSLVAGCGLAIETGVPACIAASRFHGFDPLISRLLGSTRRLVRDRGIVQIVPPGSRPPVRSDRYHQARGHVSAGLPSCPCHREEFAVSEVNG